MEEIVVFQFMRRIRDERKIAVAGDFGVGIWIVHDFRIGMGMCVNKAWGEGKAFGVNGIDARRMHGSSLGDGFDAALVDADIRHVGGVAETIEQFGVEDDELGGEFFDHGWFPIEGAKGTKGTVRWLFSVI